MHKNDTRPFSVWDIPLALVLLTRLPLPRLPDQMFSRQAQSAWAFPIVGLVVSGLACGVAWIALWANLPSLIVAILLVATLTVATGALHEDGLADTFDGLWGGHTTDRRLEIMKDSHIGTYGVLALILSQALRMSAIFSLVDARLLTGVVAASLFSRALMPILMFALPNARKSGLSQSVGIPRFTVVAIGFGLAVILTFILLGASAIGPMLCALLACGLVARIAKAKIGGQTGDVLGATQQVGEIAFLLAVVASL